jgi:hypothetical protein
MVLMSVVVGRGDSGVRGHHQQLREAEKYLWNW